MVFFRQSVPDRYGRWAEVQQMRGLQGGQMPGTTKVTVAADGFGMMVRGRRGRVADGQYGAHSRQQQHGLPAPVAHGLHHISYFGRSLGYFRSARANCSRIGRTVACASPKTRR